MATYKVLRRMEGDKLYEAGDTRELNKADAGHLVALGVLQPVDAEDEQPKGLAPAPKAEHVPSNKMEAAPSNKAAPAPEKPKG